ncbi:MAG: hypothetical protein ACK4SY_09775 [Pyrobaculum sp.]
MELRRCSLARLWHQTAATGRLIASLTDAFLHINQTGHSLTTLVP